MSMNLQEPLQQNQKHNPQHSSFPLWAQFSCVFLYFGFDLILRFCYQAVLDGNNLLLQLSATRTDKADESYSTIQDASSYNKPAFLVLCCYTTFILWGPLVVFPYLLYFYRQRRDGGGGHDDNNAISSSTAAAVIFQYYTQEWSGALSFSRAFLYTCCMGMILFLGNLGYVSGLRYISVALGSALSQGEAPLTVFLSVVVLGRYFGRWEKRGIVLSLLGIALIAIPPVLWTSRRENDDDDDDFDNNVSTGTTSTWEQQLGGVISTFLGAFGFGAYQVFWPYFDEKRYSTTSITTTTASKSHNHHHNHHPVAPTTPIHAIIDTLATLTLVGFFLLSTGWILILFLHITGLEPFEIPPKEIRATLMISSILSALTDALNGIACVVASTVVVALAYPLIIPLSVLLQWWVDGISPSKWGALGWIGTVSVVAGVFCLESSGGGDGDGGGVGGAGDFIGSRDHDDDDDDDDDDGTTARTTLQEEGSKVQFVEMGRMIKIMSKKEDEKEEEKETAQPTPRAITELV